MSLDLESVAEDEGSSRMAGRRPGLLCHRLSVPPSKSLSPPVPVSQPYAGITAFPWLIAAVLA